MTALALILAASLPVRTVTLAGAALSKPIRIDCPVNQVTRIVFPEPFVNVRVSAGGREALGVVPETSRPRGVLRVMPPSHPGKATVEVKGPSVALTVVLQTVASGVASEVRLALDERPAAPNPVAASVQPRQDAPVPPAKPAPKPATPAETAPSPALGVVGAVSRSPEPKEPPAAFSVDPAATPDVLGVAAETTTPPESIPSLAVSAAARTLDLQALALAKPVPIGRREGQPGRPEMVLEHALKGERWIWLRFVLDRGQGAAIETVSWERGTEHGEAIHVDKQDGKDLVVIAQLPRSEVTKKTRVTVKVKQGGEYRFAVSSATFTTFLKSLF